MAVAASNPLPLRVVAAQPALDEAEIEVSVLTRQMRDGSDAGWRAFHSQFYFGLLRLATSRVGSADDALDVMQQVYLRVARHIKVFHDEREFRRWLGCIVRCAASDYRRGVHRRALLLEKFAHWQEAQCATSVWSTEPAVQASTAHEALRHLPAEDAELLRQKYYEGWSVEQLAARSGVTPKAIENRLARSRQRLREAILRKQ